MSSLGASAKIDQAVGISVPHRSIRREVVVGEHAQREIVTTVERKPEDAPTTHVLMVDPREAAASRGQVTELGCEVRAQAAIIARLCVGRE
jgi:hypothetical protein